jgi:hypothetical protein
MDKPSLARRFFMRYIVVARIFGILLFLLGLCVEYPEAQSTARFPPNSSKQYETYQPSNPMGKSPIVRGNIIEARKLITAKNYTKAIDLLQQTTRLEPENKNVHSLLGEAFFDLEQYQDAEKAFKKALQLDPNNFAYKNWLSEVYKKLGRNREYEELAKDIRVTLGTPQTPKNVVPFEANIGSCEAIIGLWEFSNGKPMIAVTERIEILKDGKLIVHLGTMDLGQGSGGKSSLNVQGKCSMLGNNQIKIWFPSHFNGGREVTLDFSIKGNTLILGQGTYKRSK